MIASGGDIDDMSNDSLKGIVSKLQHTGSDRTVASMSDTPSIAAPQGPQPPAAQKKRRRRPHKSRSSR